jgi:hypothetical protein
MKIAVVILNWNGRNWLEQFLPSVTAYSGEHPIYIADNASTDDSVHWLEAHYPAVKIIAMDSNRGYAGGYNEALKHIHEPIACLLNSDIEVTPQWLNPIVQRFIDEPKLAALQPKILDFNNKDYFEYAGAAGGYVDRFAYPYCRGRIFNTIEKDNGQYNDRPSLDWASGAVFFVRMEAYREVGGMDASYFAHQEEVDLCWRMRLAGYTISYEPESVVYHIGGGTLSALSPQKTFLNFRNSLFNIVKNDYSGCWFFVLILRMMLDGIAAIRFLVSLEFKHFASVFRAHISFYAHFKEMWKKRRLFKRQFQGQNGRVKSVVYQYFMLNKKIFTDF